MRQAARNGNVDFRPDARYGIQLEGPSHFGHTLFDADQSNSPRLGREHEALAVVLDDYDIAILRQSQLDYHRARFRVPGAVGEGFLNDPVQAGLVRIRELLGAAVVIQDDANRRARRELFGVPAQSRAETQIV